TAATMPDFGVHVVGEVEWRGADRQVHHLALGRERVDAVLDQLAVDLAEQVGGALALLGVAVQQPPHPLDLAVERGIAGGGTTGTSRSEERRVGKEGRDRRSPEQCEKQVQGADPRREATQSGGGGGRTWRQ